MPWCVWRFLNMYGHISNHQDEFHSRHFPLYRVLLYSLKRRCCCHFPWWMLVFEITFRSWLLYRNYVDSQYFLPRLYWFLQVCLHCLPSVLSFTHACRCLQNQWDSCWKLRKRTRRLFRSDSHRNDYCLNSYQYCMAHLSIHMVWRVWLQQCDYHCDGYFRNNILCDCPPKNQRRCQYPYLSSCPHLYHIPSMVCTGKQPWWNLQSIPVLKYKYSIPNYIGSILYLHCIDNCLWINQEIWRNKLNCCCELTSYGKRRWQRR